MIWLMESLKIYQEEQLLITLRHKAFNIAKNPKYDGYQRGLASMVYKLFDKKSAGSGVTILANKSTQNTQLSEELHKPIIGTLKKQHFEFKDNICGADLAITKQV